MTIRSAVRNRFLIALFALPLVATAQRTIFDDERTLFAKEISGGFVAHGDGWGFNFQHGTYTTARKRRVLALEIVGMKHPKEVKSFNPYYEDSRGYFYGKINSLLLIRPAFGGKYQITDKIRRSGVEVNLVWGAGPSLGLLKPVYLQIGKPNIPYETIVVERYDPQVHFVDDIFGRASWFRGLEESRFVVGGFGRAGVNFEHSGENAGLKAIEVGACIDAFAEEVPIMAELEGVENKRVFFEFYASLMFGKKYIR